MWAMRASCIRPTNNPWDVRLARAARHLIYGESLTASGPVPRNATRDGARSW